MLSIPTLETERLILRGWREDDLDAYTTMMSDPEVTRFIGGVQTRNDCWRSIAANIGHWVFRGHGMWAVERKSDGALVGRIGVWRPEGWPATEVVWALGRPTGDMAMPPKRPKPRWTSDSRRSPFHSWFR
jgi:RimJ/RimL family protein N-acetyltransferase